MKHRKATRGIVECGHCGAAADAAVVACPVCELPLDGSGSKGPLVGREPPEAGSFLGRAWQSGRGAAVTAAALFLASTFVPLVRVQRAHEVGAQVSATPLQLAMGEGVYGRELKSAVVLAIPAAALGLLSFVWSRRSGSIMRASRPLVLVVSLLPAAAAALPILRIARLERFKYEPGVALALVALGAIAGLVGALRFGAGVPDVRPSGGRLGVRARGGSDDRHDDDDDDDDVVAG